MRIMHAGSNPAINNIKSTKTRTAAAKNMKQ
jgi:hypothetical protein